MKKILISFTSALLFLITITSCHVPSAGEVASKEKVLSTSLNLAQPKTTQYTAAPYDVLSITIYQHPEYSVEQVMVLDDGSVSLPGIGKIKIAGLKLSQINELLVKKYSKILKHPRISIMPIKVVGSRYYVLGAVNNPGGYPLLNTTTILDAVGLAGGTSPDASLYRWYLIRNKQVFPLNPSQPDQLKKILISQGDTIIVENSNQNRVIVLGAVSKPGSYPLQSPHPTLWEAIAEAGGFREDALRSEIGILHWDTGKVKIRIVSSFYPELKDLADIFIAPDDIIYVPTHPIGEWNKIISLIQPTISLFLVQPFGVVRDYFMIKDLQRRQ